MNYVHIFLVSLTLFSAATLNAMQVYAQTVTGSSNSSTSEMIYEHPTIKTFSQLYWAVGMMDIENDKHVDNFMKINECEIYSDYIDHEFEWIDIRNSAKSYIQENQKNFPLRFEFSQSIKLTNYDLEKGVFSIARNHAIKGSKRFFIPAKDADNSVCEDSRALAGYPDTLLLELSKPFVLEEVPMEKEAANKFISERLLKNKGAKRLYQSNTSIYDRRRVVLVMNVKLFANQGSKHIRNKGAAAHVLGVLESFQIYKDASRKELMWEQDYLNRMQSIDTSQLESLLEEERLMLEQAAQRKADKEAADAAAQEPQDKEEKT